MSAQQKKVTLRRFHGSILHGYLPPSGFVQGDEINYLNLEGRLTPLPLLDLKSISYVRDFNLLDAINPERLQRRTFIARPRGEGLWIRITFRDDADVLEGLAPADTSLLDGLISDAGMYFLPPDTRSNTQRIYVPRVAIASLQILSVINPPSMRRATDSKLTVDTSPAPLLQNVLFDGAPELPSKRGKHGSNSK